MTARRSLWVRLAWVAAGAAGVAATAAALPPQVLHLPPPGAPDSAPRTGALRPAAAQAPPGPATELPAPRSLPDGATTGKVATAAEPGTLPIDMASALKLAGAENPQILIARARVVEAVALRQQAAALLLPSLNLGLNYDAHTGPLQQSSGNVLKVNRSSLYVGAGANAVAAGTVSIPGLVYNLNVAEAIYRGLIARRGIARARFAEQAVRNEMFRRVGTAYAELLRAEGRRSIAVQTRNEADQVARLTRAFAKAGLIALADVERATNELERRRSDLAQAEAEVLIRSAQLAELLGLDRAARLHPIEERAVPISLVPDPIPLSQLLAIALLQRPELGENRVAIEQALLELDGAKLLPFSPSMIVGFSAGTYGGGSGLIASDREPRFGAPPSQTRFGNFRARNDFDVVAYWTLRNLGIGNKALVSIAASKVGVNQLEQLKTLNMVRRQVAEAHILTHARFAQLSIAESAVKAGQRAFLEDFRRVEGNVGRPLELLQSLRLLADARYGYLDAIVAYNQAQVNLYVALGQPPADTLARPVPTDFSAPVPRLEERPPAKKGGL